MAHQRPVNTTSTTNHVNPFYIEPSNRDQWDSGSNSYNNGTDWRYDDDLGDDDGDYYEEEQLLGGRAGGSSQQRETAGGGRRADDGGGGRGGREDMGEYGLHRRQGQQSGLSPRLCIAASLIFTLFFFILSSLTGSSDGDTRNHRGSGNGKSGGSPAAVPPPSPPDAGTASAELQPQETPSPPSQEGAPEDNNNSPSDGKEDAAAANNSTEVPANGAGNVTEKSGQGGEDSGDSDQQKEEQKEEEEDQQETPPANEAATAEPPQFQVIVLGERNSGLEALMRKAPACFDGGRQNSSVVFRSGYPRPGYWFQFVPPLMASKLEDGIRKNSTIVLYVVRHPATWTEAMRLRPLKMPDHYNRTADEPLPWRSFVDRPMSTTRPPQDASKKPSETCQLKFTYSEVMPCHAVSEDGSILVGNDTAATAADNEVDSAAVYELNIDGGGGSSKPFENLLQLRGAKIRHVLDGLPNREWLRQALVRKKVESPDGGQVEKTALFVVKYEDPKSVLSALKKVEQITGWSRTCQNDTELGLQSGDEDQQVSETLTSDPEYVRAITDRVDWDAEGMVGYAQDSQW